METQTTIGLADASSELQKPIWAAVKWDGVQLIDVPYQEAWDKVVALKDKSAVVVLASVARRGEGGMVPSNIDEL